MTTRGRKIFDKHMDYVYAGDIDGMVRDTIADDAIFYHNFPFFESPPPFVISGKENILAALKHIMGCQGAVKLGELFDWSESDSHIAYQVVVHSPLTGPWQVLDFWLLRDDRIVQYVAYANKIPFDRPIP